MLSIFCFLDVSYLPWLIRGEHFIFFNVYLSFSELLSFIVGIYGVPSRDWRWYMFTNDGHRLLLNYLSSSFGGDFAALPFIPGFEIKWIRFPVVRHQGAGFFRALPSSVRGEKEVPLDFEAGLPHVFFNWGTFAFECIGNNAPLEVFKGSERVDTEWSLVHHSIKGDCHRPGVTNEGLLHLGLDYNNVSRGVAENESDMLVPVIVLRWESSDSALNQGV